MGSSLPRHQPRQLLEPVEDDVDLLVMSGRPSVAPVTYAGEPRFALTLRWSVSPQHPEEVLDHLEPVGLRRFFQFLNHRERLAIGR